MNHILVSFFVIVSLIS